MFKGTKLCVWIGMGCKMELEYVTRGVEWQEIMLDSLWPDYSKLCVLGFSVKSMPRKM